MILRLSPAGVQDVIDRLDTLKSNINQAVPIITKNVIEEGVKRATIYNASAPQSGLTKSDVGSKFDRGNQDGKSSGEIFLRGDSAVYDEFGTGTQGENDPHPVKNSVKPTLRGYNTGPYIRTDKNGGKYWFYKPMAGVNIYYQKDNGFTRGIPSGKQMYHTLQDLPDIARDIIDEEMNNAIKEFTGRD